MLAAPLNVRVAPVLIVCAVVVNVHAVLPVVNALVVVACLTVDVLPNVAVIVTALLFPFTTVIAPEILLTVAHEVLLLE